MEVFLLLGRAAVEYCTQTYYLMVLNDLDEEIREWGFWRSYDHFSTIINQHQCNGCILVLAQLVTTSYPES